MKEEDFLTTRGKAVWFGQVRVPAEVTAGKETPAFSYVVIERMDDTGYISTCIPLLIDGYGKDKEYAVTDMVDNITYFLRKSFQGDEDSAWLNLYELSKSNPRSDALWDVYHALLYESARRGDKIILY